MRVAIGPDLAGFNLSYEAVMLYAKLKGLDIKAYKLTYAKEPSEREFTEWLPGDSYYNLFYDLNGNGSETFMEIRDDIERHDPCLIQAIEQLQEKATQDGNLLKIIDTPDNIEYWIDRDGETDGYEVIREKSRMWK